MKKNCQFLPGILNGEGEGLSGLDTHTKIPDSEVNKEEVCWDRWLGGRRLINEKK
jgi:hypothetical protein